MVLCLLCVGLLVVSVRGAGARHPQPRGAGPSFSLCLVCCLLIVCLIKFGKFDVTDSLFFIFEKFKSVWQVHHGLRGQHGVARGYGG